MINTDFTNENILPDLAFHEKPGPIPDVNINGIMRQIFCRSFDLEKDQSRGINDLLISEIKCPSNREKKMLTWQSFLKIQDAGEVSPKSVRAYKDMHVVINPIYKKHLHPDEKRKKLKREKSHHELWNKDLWSRLKNIAYVLSQKDSFGLSLRKKENMTLSIDASSKLKWVEQKSILNDILSNQKTNVIEFIFRTLKLCLLELTEYNFASYRVFDEEGDIIQTIQLLLGTPRLLKTLENHDELTASWIKILLINTYLKPLHDVIRMHSILLRAETDIKIILERLKKNQEIEIKSIIRDYIKPMDERSRTLGGVIYSRLLVIIKRLDLEDLASDEKDFDEFIPLLSDLIFKKPQNVLGFNHVYNEPFEKFFEDCRKNFEAYETFITSILRDDSGKLPLLNFIKNLPPENEDMRAEAKTFFKEHKYQECIELLGKHLSRCLTIPNQGFYSMLKQLIKKGINALKKRHPEKNRVEAVVNNYFAKIGTKTNPSKPLIECLNVVAKQIRLEYIGE
jgi:hypothetical protein